MRKLIILFILLIPFLAISQQNGYFNNLTIEGNSKLNSVGADPGSNSALTIDGSGNVYQRDIDSSIRDTINQVIIDSALIDRTELADTATAIRGAIGGGFSVTNEGDNRVVTSLGVGLGGNAEQNMTFTGSLLSVTGKFAIDDGFGSAFVGTSAGANDGGNRKNSAFGFEALRANILGINNTALGYQAMEDGTGNQDHNVAIGYQAMKTGGGDFNVMVGAYAGDPYSGSGATYIGYDAGGQGSASVAVGWQALNSTNAGGYDNTGVGYHALTALTSGEGNTGVGKSVMESSGVDADFNTALGKEAGYNLEGDRNIMIGYQAGYNKTSGDDELYIENSNSASPLIWGDFANDTIRINGEFDYTQNIHGYIGGDSLATSVTISASDTWYHMSNAGSRLLTGIDLDNLTLSNDTIYFSVGGRIHADASVSYAGGAGGEDWEFRWLLNNSTGSLVTPRTTSSTAVGNLSIKGAFDVSAGDYLVLQVNNDTDTDNPTIELVAILINKVDSD